MKIICISSIIHIQGRSQAFLMGESWGQNEPKKGCGGGRGFATHVIFPLMGVVEHTQKLDAPLYTYIHAHTYTHKIYNIIFKSTNKFIRSN
jgi:hypothetical protein